MRLIMVLTCFFLGNCAFCQNTFHIGFGILNSNPHIENASNPDASHINNYFVSASAGKVWNRYLDLEMELSYKTKGYSTRIGIEQLDILVRNYSYIGFAPNAEFKIFEKFSLQLGYNLSYKLDEKRRQTSIGSNPWVKTNEINTWDQGILTAIKYNHRQFYFKLGYEYGLINIMKEDLTNPSPDIIQKNRSITLGLGYFFVG